MVRYFLTVNVKFHLFMRIIFHLFSGISIAMKPEDKRLLSKQSTVSNTDFTDFLLGPVEKAFKGLVGSFTAWLWNRDYMKQDKCKNCFIWKVKPVFKNIWPLQACFHGEWHIKENRKCTENIKILVCFHWNILSKKQFKFYLLRIRSI